MTYIKEDNVLPKGEHSQKYTCIDTTQTQFFLQGDLIVNSGIFVHIELTDAGIAMLAPSHFISFREK